jgi:hypothetical protein
VRVDVGDAHAVLGLVCGAIAVAATATCCLDMWRDDELIYALIAVVLVTLWSGTFGLVLRGTWITRLVATVALACACLSAFLGFVAILLD